MIEGNDREMVIERVIDAPQDLIFRAFTEADHVKHWWGPNGFTNTIHEMDVRPGGAIFFSTLNRNARSYLFAVVGAEYVLKLLPRGTHDYARFIRPSELARLCRRASLEWRGLTGMTYNPLTRQYALKDGDTSVNYLAHAVRPGA